MSCRYYENGGEGTKKEKTAQLFDFSFSYCKDAEYKKKKGGETVPKKEEKKHQHTYRMHMDRSTLAMCAKARMRSIYN